MVLFLVSIIGFAYGLDNGLGLLPQMGYNSWYSFGCHVNQTLIMETAKAFGTLGLDKLGYEYVNIDDCMLFISHQFRHSLSI